MLRIDDIPQQVADDIHAFGVIGARIVLNLLHPVQKYAIINSERRWGEESLLSQPTELAQEGIKDVF